MRTRRRRFARAWRTTTKRSRFGSPAIKALAALCDRESTQLLTDLAQRAPGSMASDEDIQLGLTAAEALGKLHPVDLAARLAPLAAKDARAEARTAAARALAATPSCK